MKRHLRRLMLTIRATLPIARAMVDELSTLVHEVVRKGPWHRKYIDNKVKFVEALASALEELCTEWKKDVKTILESLQSVEGIDKASESGGSLDIPSAS